MTNQDRLLSDEELEEAISEIRTKIIRAKNSGYDEALNDMDYYDKPILNLINTQRRLYAESQYQTYIYKQDHPRLEAKGIEIWGVRIAHQGQCIYGDIASSKEEAEDKLANELNRLRAESEN